MVSHARALHIILLFLSCMTFACSIQVERIPTPIQRIVSSPVRITELDGPPIIRSLKTPLKPEYKPLRFVPSKKSRKREPAKPVNPHFYYSNFILFPNRSDCFPIKSLNPSLKKAAEKILQITFASAAIETILGKSKPIAYISSNKIDKVLAKFNRDQVEEIFETLKCNNELCFLLDENNEAKKYPFYVLNRKVFNQKFELTPTFFKTLQINPKTNNREIIEKLSRRNKKSSAISIYILEVSDTTNSNTKFKKYISENFHNISGKNSLIKKIRNLFDDGTRMCSCDEALRKIDSNLSPPKNPPLKYASIFKEKPQPKAKKPSKKQKQIDERKEIERIKQLFSMKKTPKNKLKEVKRKK